MRFVFVLCLSCCVWAAEETVPEVAQQLQKKLASGETEGSIDLVGRLVSHYPKAGKPDQVIAMRALGKAAGAKDVELRHAAFSALGKLHVPGSGKYLRRWLSPPKKGDVAESYLKAIETAGEIADPRTLRKVVGLTDHKNEEVAVAAVRALGGYRTLPVPARKKLAMDLVRKLEQLSSGGTRGWGRGAAQSTRRETEETGTPLGRPTSGRDAAARAAVLRTAISRTLETVTGTRCGSVAEWVSWRKRAKRVKDPFA